MFSRNWLHSIAVRGCTILALTFVFSAGVSHAQNNAGTPAQQPNQQQAAPTPPPVVQQPIAEPDYYKIACEAPKDHDAADLCEQRRMAKAAEESVWWARLQTWLGGFGLIGVVITLAFTAVATKAASRSARTAERALTDLERPFVYVSIPESGLGMFGDGRGSYERALVFECVNLGRTPADLLDIVDDFVEIDTGQWPDQIIPATGDRTLPPGTVSAVDRPHQTRIQLAQRFGSQSTRGRLGIDTDAFLIGYVRYADVFGIRYITGFCAMYDIVSGNFVLRGDDRYNYSRKEK